MSSERPPKEPIVDERPRKPRRMGAAFGDERAECTDFVESLRNKDPAPGEAKFIEAAVRATCEGEGIGDVLPPFSTSRRNALLMAVSGGLSPGEWWAELLLIPLVDARGVAGAVSGNSGGVIFIGRGNKDARCFRRPNPKRPELGLEVSRGLGVFSKDTCPPELPSDRDDSEARGTGRDSVEVPSADS
jgi:hypothetical protein